ncbi:MAG TPA: LysM peptidoglycan-binding domain-containing protein, partial [Acidimicrobiales bacterium]|nr:LysM peptidoglycan-binding domain-containing protein [Acidimicrobiales bacterium]
GLVEAHVAGLTLPDRVAVSSGLEAPSRHRHEVTVEPGDSLWHVAERLLGPAATDRAVAREWREIYALNRDRLGPDPDLIFPGTVLRLPEPTAPDREDP